MTNKLFYHCYVAGYSSKVSTLGEAQEWLDSIRSSVIGKTFTVHKFINCLSIGAPLISGPVTN